LFLTSLSDTSIALPAPHVNPFVKNNFVFISVQSFHNLLLHRAKASQGCHACGGVCGCPVVAILLSVTLWQHARQLAANKIPISQLVKLN